MKRLPDAEPAFTIPPDARPIIFLVLEKMLARLAAQDAAKKTEPAPATELAPTPAETTKVLLPL